MLATCSALRPNILSVGEPLEHVEEERAQLADLGEATLGDRPRPAADEGEQQDQDRPGERAGRARSADRSTTTAPSTRSGTATASARAGWNDRDVGVQRIEPVDDDAGQLAAPLAPVVGRARARAGGRSGRPAGAA